MRDEELFHLEHGRAGPVYRVAVSGEVDLASAGSTALAVQGYRRCVPLPDVVVDLAGVTFLDCAGAAFLLRLRRVARRQGRRVVVADPSPDVMRLLAHLNLGDVEVVRPGSEDPPRHAGRQGGGRER